MSKFLDQNGVAYLWSKVKQHVEESATPPVETLPWESITGKPELALKTDGVAWENVTGKPELALKTDGVAWEDVTGKPELALKTDGVAWENVTGKPELALKTDGVAWENVTGKPELALKTDGVAWENVTGKPELALKTDGVAWENVTGKPELALKTDGVAWENVTGKPELALKTDSVSWERITGKPDLALKSDLTGSGGSGIPSGAIIIWSGSGTDIPDGWALCDGENNTPDLRGRFVLGANDTYAAGTSGGEATHKLTVEEIPSHKHPLYATRGDTLTGSYGSLNVNNYNTSHSSAETRSTGGSKAHNNMPPYYALCYIMKL